MIKVSRLERRFTNRWSRALGLDLPCRDVTRGKGGEVSIPPQITALDGGFHVALEATLSAMILFDDQNVIRASNSLADEMFASSDEVGLLGTALEALIPEAARARHAMWVEDYNNTPTRRELGRGRHLEARRLDGTLFPIEIGLSPVTYHSQRWVICAIIDISQRLELERAAIRRAADARKLESLSRLARGVGHDLNNLLGCVVSNAEYVLSHGLPVEYEESLLDVLEASKHSSALASQLLTYAGVVTQEFDDLVVDEVIASFEYLLRTVTGQNVRLQLGLRSDGARVSMNIMHIQQVMVNLVQNAAAAVDHAGAIVVRAYRRRLEMAPWIVAPDKHANEDFVMIEVIDNGHGMDASTIARMCDPFFSTRGEGRGMGMAVVRGILENHGAGMFVESRVGQGTKICLCFPRSRCEDV